MGLHRVIEQRGKGLHINRYPLERQVIDKLSIGIARGSIADFKIRPTDDTYAWHIDIKAGELNVPDMDRHPCRHTARL